MREKLGNFVPVALVVQDANRVPNQRLHRTVAAQPPVAPRLPVSRGAVRRHVSVTLQLS